MHLTPEDLDKVRTKNIANLLRRAGEGKPLTRAQQAELETFANSGRDSTDRGTGASFVKTQEELAERLGITRKTIGNCLRRYKSHPTHPVPKTRADGRYDVVAWGAFLRFHNVAHKGEGPAATSTPGDPEDASNEPYGASFRTVTDWKQEELRLRCQRIQLEIAKTEGLLVELADLQGTLGVTFSAFRTSLNNLPGRAAQKLIGLRDYHEIEGILQEEIATVLRTLESCQYLPGEGEIIGLSESAKSAVMLKRSGKPLPPDSWDDCQADPVPAPRTRRKTPVAQGKLPKPRKARGRRKA